MYIVDWIFSGSRFLIHVVVSWWFHSSKIHIWWLDLFLSFVVVSLFHLNNLLMTFNLVQFFQYFILWLFLSVFHSVFSPYSLSHSIRLTWGVILYWFRWNIPVDIFDITVYMCIILNPKSSKEFSTFFPISFFSQYAQYTFFADFLVVVGVRKKNVKSQVCTI